MTSQRLQFGRYSVEIHHLDKTIYPDAGINKQQVIDYYRAVAEHMLTYLQDRPLTVHRFPDGIGTNGFYQQRADEHFPDWLDTASLPTEGGAELRHMVCNRQASLVYLANLACLSLHGWLARSDRPEHPDRLVFDLDPPKGRFDLARDAAGQLRELLKDLGLPSWLLATGGRGLHLWVPLDRRADFATTREFARRVAQLLASRAPKRFTTEVRKDQRQGRLFIDYLRNAYGQTSIMPYSLRARPGAPAAVPLAWDELHASDCQWCLNTVLQRLAQQSEDPWHGMRRRAHGLKPARRRLARLEEED